MKNAKCTLCKETKTENFRIKETTKGKAEEGGCNKVVVLVLYIYLYMGHTATKPDKVNIGITRISGIKI